MGFGTLRSWLPGWFHKPPPIADVNALEEFLDSHAAFIVQKCIYEYARARAGTLSLSLFKEEGFKKAVEISRWSNYPIGLGNVSEMVMNTLRADAGDRQVDLVEHMIAAVCAVTGQYTAPDGFPVDFWVDVRAGLDARLRRAALAEPKPVKDIPLPTVDEFFDRLPIHERLRGYDHQLIQNNLRINLCRSYEVFIERVDSAALLADLLADRSSVALPVTGRSGRA